MPLEYQALRELLKFPRPKNSLLETFCHEAHLQSFVLLCRVLKHPLAVLGFFINLFFLEFLEPEAVLKHPILRPTLELELG